MISSRALLTILISVATLVPACNGEDRKESIQRENGTESRRALVVTSNYPLYYFANRITQGVDAAPEIVFPVIDGDPATWMPDAGQIQLLQSADVVALNGAGAEPWLDLITLNQRRLLDTSSGIADRLIPLEDSVQHQHGPQGEHSHQGTAFTTWLDPQLAIAQAEVLTNAFSRLAPSAEAQFIKNMANLKLDLLELDTELARVFAGLNGQPLLFSHRVYQYLERRYRINGESVHFEPGEGPTTPAWIELQQILARHPAKMMIWEDRPLNETEARLADAGVVSIPFPTIASRPDEGDYLSVMRDSSKRLETFLAASH